MKLNEKMNKIKNSTKSVRVKLFITICIATTMIVLLLILINSIVLEKFYLYNKTQIAKETYEEINVAYDKELSYKKIEEKLNILAINHNIDIMIKTTDNKIILTTNKYNSDSEEELLFFNNIIQQGKKEKTLYEEENFEVNLIKEKQTNINYIIVQAKLNNGYELYILTPIAILEESARISNNVLIAIGSAVIIISGILASVISKKFTNPILELDNIARKMSNLDFSQKYEINNTEDEINNLGKSINIMSDKLEKTIKQLTKNNIELEKDIEEKSKIDEMRKQFISDVSHELKTPISLIQGYAEGLVENVNADDESRQFYASVILDEAEKMDKLVKQLLELMKIESGKLNLNNENFDIVNLIKDVIKKCNVMIQENNINIKFDYNNEVIVYADIFYIEQIITNYLTNAIKYSKEINGQRNIELNVFIDNKQNKIRITVFNTGENIEEEELQRIWGRFYKIDTSRSRENGGTGIGLAFVKAIMNNYKNKFGVENKENGIEFFFELNMEQK